MAVGFFWFGESMGLASIIGLVAIATGGLVTLVDPRHLALRALRGLLPAFSLNMPVASRSYRFA
jgi:hypothetical protein